MRRAMLCGLMLVACGPDDAAPSELLGRYNVQIDGINGCDNDPDLVGWMLGPLQVTAAEVDLVFDFGDGFSFEGSATDGGRFSYVGSAQVDELSYFASGGGTVEGTNGSWRLIGEGTSTIQDDGDLNCSIVASFTAIQIAE